MKLADVFKEKLSKTMSKTEAFLVNAEVNQNEWIKTQHFVENRKIEIYMESKEIMGFSHEEFPMVRDAEDVVIDFKMLKEMLSLFERNGENNAIILYVKKNRPLFITDEKIWGMIAPRVEDTEEVEKEIKESREIIVPIVEGKHTTELGKIMELQKLIDKAKNLIFAAQNIDCTIDYPYCKEIEIGKPNASMSKQLAEIRSTLEWMDNMCWAYQGLKK